MRVVIQFGVLYGWFNATLGDLLDETNHRAE